MAKMGKEAEIYSSFEILHKKKKAWEAAEKKPVQDFGAKDHKLP